MTAFPRVKVLLHVHENVGAAVDLTRQHDGSDNTGSIQDELDRGAVVQDEGVLFEGAAMDFDVVVETVPAVDVALRRPRSAAACSQIATSVVSCISPVATRRFISGVVIS